MACVSACYRKNDIRSVVVTDAKDGFLHCERPPFTVPETVFGGGEGRLYDCILVLF